MNIIGLLRRLIDEQLRPGREGTATTSGHAPVVGVSAGRAHFALYFDATAGVTHRTGVYGRGRYGRVRYR
jgi:hypothetical protein